MGLDTVELLQTMEEHFSIAIADREASAILTVQDLADCVYAKIVLTPALPDKDQAVYQRLLETLQKLGAPPELLQPQAKIKDVLKDLDFNSCWQVLEVSLELKLPSLTSEDLDLSLPRQRKILGVRIQSAPVPLTEGSLRDLTRWILALNHRQILNPKALSSKAELEGIVVGIVSESSGIPVTEIEMHHHITGDLGMD